MPVPLSKFAITPLPEGNAGPPALVWERAPSPLTDSGHWEMTDAGQMIDRPRVGDPLVFFIEKGQSTNNPFAMGVTVGRVENNDLVVDDASVSRFHAWFQLDERSGQWTLTDAESKNGTWVDGARLEARQRLTLRDGAQLKFGDVEMIFFLPPTLRQYVEQRAYKSKR